MRSLPAGLGLLLLVACNDSTGLTPRPGRIQLAFFDPLGVQATPESTPMAPTAMGAGVTASNLQNITHGFLSGNNTNRRPAMLSVGPLNLATSFYLEFTITPTTAGLGVFLTTVSYTYTSYQTGATGTISLRTSADSFATTLDSKAVVGGTFPDVTALVFDASSAHFVKGPLTVRLYMHDLVGGTTPLPAGFPAEADFADLVSTALAGGDGMRVWGNVHTN